MLELRLSVTLLNLPPGFPTDQRNGDKEFVIRRAATNRVLNVLRHWVSKHSQVHFNLFLLFVVSLRPSVSFEKKKQTSVMTLLVAPQDFELNTELKMRVIGFLEEVMHDPELLTQERKAAANIIRSGFLVSSHTQSYDRCICQQPVEKKKVPATVFMMPTIVAMVDDNWRTGGTIHRPLLWPKFTEPQFRGATERKHSSPPFL